MLRTLVLATAVCATFSSAFSADSGKSDAKKREFVILNDDGYGTSDCLAKPSACGKIVADAWCESKGFAKAASYRPASADDVTGSAGSARSILSETFVISCAE